MGFFEWLGISPRDSPKVEDGVRLLAESVAGLPLHLYKYSDSGGRDKERATDHPLYKLLYRQPNPEITSFSFFETLMTHLLLYGNTYAQIIRDGNADEQLKALQVRKMEETIDFLTHKLKTMIESPGKQENVESVLSTRLM